MSPSPTDALLAALESEAPTSFIALCSRHANRAGFDELAQSLSKKAKPRMCEALLKQTQAAVEALLTPLGEEEEDEAAMEEAAPPTARPPRGAPRARSRAAQPHDIALSVLEGVTLLAAALVGACAAQPPAPGEASPFATLALLHDNLLLLPSVPMPTQDAVCRLCESWWHADLARKEELIAKAVPYVLMRTLGTTKVADVKRCHALRGALELLDWEDESCEGLKTLLCRCTASPAFLRAPEGRRLLSHLFTLHPSLSALLYAVLRGQTPACRASALDAYAEVLFRAWRSAAGPPLAHLQLHILPGIASSALSARTPALAAACRRLLSAFCAAKGAAGVDACLLAALRPTLFRALAAPNPAVRRNGAALFFQAFPLQAEAGAGAEEAEGLMRRQAQAISDLLADDAPAVRAVATAGVADVLDGYWELLPAKTVAQLAQQLADGLSRDASSAAVRAAAAQGLARLVSNPAAQPVLAALLPQPRLEHLASDAAAPVRAAFADLLLAVRGVRAIRFTAVLPLDGLLGWLAGEAEAGIATQLTKLLLPTYFPGGAPLTQAAERLMALAVSHPATAAAFARRMAGAGVPTPGLHALAALLAAALAQPPPEAAAGGERRKRKEAAAEAGLPAEAWEAAAATLAELCEGLARDGEVGAARPKLGKAAAAKAKREAAKAAKAAAAAEEEEEEEEEADGEAPPPPPGTAAILAALRAAPSPAGRAAVLAAGRWLVRPPAEERKGARAASAAQPLLAHCRAALLGRGGEALGDEEAASLLAGLCAWGGAGELCDALSAALAPAGRAAAHTSPDGALRLAEIAFRDPAARAALLDSQGAQHLLDTLRAAALARLAAGGGAESAAALLAAGKAAMHAAAMGRGGGGEALAELLAAAVAAAAAAPAAPAAGKRKGAAARGARKKKTVAMDEEEEEEEEEAEEGPVTAEALADALAAALALAAEGAALGFFEAGGEGAARVGAAAGEALRSCRLPEGATQFEQATALAALAAV